MRNFFNVIVVKVQEDKRWQANQIFNFLDVIVLKVEETKPFFSLEQGHMSQVSLV